MACSHVLLELSCKLQSVHYGHHNVADDQFGNLAARLLQSLLAVGSLRNVVFILQYRAQIGAHTVVVVDDKHERTFVVEVLGISDAFAGSIGVDVHRHIVVVNQILVLHSRRSLLVVGRVVALLCVGQRHDERRALARLALSFNRAVMHIDISLDERQSDAGAADRALCLIETFEEVGQFLGVDALARVSHGDGEVLGSVLNGGGDASSLGCIFQRIGHQIEVNVLYLVAVGYYH